MSYALKFILGLMSVVFGALAIFASFSKMVPDVTLTIAGVIGIVGGATLWLANLSKWERELQPRSQRSLRPRLRESDMYQRPSGAHILREDIDSQPPPRPLARYDRPALEDPAEYPPSHGHHQGARARLAEASSRGHIPRRRA